jgi:stage II sporulation protein P
MSSRLKRKLARTGKHPVLGKLAVIAAVFFIFKLMIGLGAETEAESVLKRIAGDSDAVTGILELELGGRRERDTISLLASESTLLGKITSLTLTPDSDAPSVAADSDTAAEAAESAIPVVEAPAPKTPSGEYYEYSLDGSGIELNNKTDYDIDIDALLQEDLNLHIDPGSPQVLIIHTHGSEAYYPDGEDIYTPSDPSRTEDKNYNVVRIGDRLAELLTGRGISVIHDRELYDYPTYTGSYTRSMEAIENYLDEYPDIKVVLDIHRDALEEKDGTIHRTYCELDGETCSQILLIAGSNYSGLEHPNWRENLKFALHIETDMNEKYPGLTRPMKLSQYRYNQQATTGSLIVEVGCTGNTLQESLRGIGYFADCLGDVLLRYAE